MFISVLPSFLLIFLLFFLTIYIEKCTGPQKIQSNIAASKKQEKIDAEKMYRAEPLTVNAGTWFLSSFVLLIFFMF